MAEGRRQRFDDRATERAALELFGGWRALCERLPGEGPELLGIAKNFKAAYGAYVRRDQRMLERLPPSRDEARAALENVKAELQKRGLPTGACGPGDKVVLRTESGDAFFAWRKFKDACIDQRTGAPQAGVNCAAFRNEGAIQSSELVRQADAIADCLWPDRRHYTYVDPKRVQSRNPGYCFLVAGWRRCGFTKGGLIVLERVIA
jgi:hypothetical protein